MVTRALLILLVAPAVWAAEKDKNPKHQEFEKQIYVVGVGQVKLKYVYAGEPISRPRALRIWVKCDGSKKWAPVGEYQMCQLDEHKFDPKAKKLSVKYLDGRVNEKTGEAICDIAGSNDLDLNTLCKPKK